MNNYEVGVLFLPQFMINRRTFPMTPGDTCFPAFPMPFDLPLVAYSRDDKVWFHEYYEEAVKLFLEQQELAEQKKLAKEKELAEQKELLEQKTMEEPAELEEQKVIQTDEQATSTKIEDLSPISG